MLTRILLRTQKCLIHVCIMNIHEATAIYVLNFGGQLVHLDMATWFWNCRSGGPGSIPGTPNDPSGHSVLEQVQNIGWESFFIESHFIISMSNNLANWSKLLFRDLYMNERDRDFALRFASCNFRKKIPKAVFDFSTFQRFLHLTILISSQQMWWCSCQISDIWQKFEKWSFIHFLVLQILSSKDRQLENARLRGQLQDTQSSGKNSVKRNRVDALTKCRD